MQSQSQVLRAVAAYSGDIEDGKVTAEDLSPLHQLSRLYDDGQDHDLAGVYGPLIGSLYTHMRGTGV